MSLSEDVDLEEFVMAKDDMSGADIKAVCTEAGLLALRERRMRVTKADFTTAREKVCLSPFFEADLFRHADGTFRYFTGRMKVHLRVFTSSCYLCCNRHVHFLGLVIRINVKSHKSLTTTPSLPATQLKRPRKYVDAIPTTPL
jgi:hypothetical protein